MNMNVRFHLQKGLGDFMVCRPHYLNVIRIVDEFSFYSYSREGETQREVTTRYLGRKKTSGRCQCKKAQANRYR